VVVEEVELVVVPTGLVAAVMVVLMPFISIM
jgi:hypothetical protein